MAPRKIPLCVSREMSMASQASSMFLRRCPWGVENQSITFMLVARRRFTTFHQDFGRKNVLFPWLLCSVLVAWILLLLLFAKNFILLSLHKKKKLMNFNFACPEHTREKRNSATGKQLLFKIPYLFLSSSTIVTGQKSFFFVCVLITCFPVANLVLHTPHPVQPRALFLPRKKWESIRKVYIVNLAQYFFYW